MKDRMKFAGSVLILFVTLTLAGIFFISGFMSDYVWLNVILTVVYMLICGGASFYTGLQRGTADCKYTRLIEKQMKERSYQPDENEKQKFFRKEKGFVAGGIAGSLGILAALVCLFCFGHVPSILTVITRFILGTYLCVFQFIPDVGAWIYLPMALLWPALVGIGYLRGPKMWEKTVSSIEKAKKDKLRKINRDRKKKKLQKELEKHQSYSSK